MLVADKFDQVLGKQRGSYARVKDSDSSYQVLKRLVAQLNEPGRLPKDSTYGDGLVDLIETQGLAVVDRLSIDRENPESHTWDFCGWLLVIAVDNDRPPFAAIRLWDFPAKEGSPFAKMLLFVGD